MLRCWIDGPESSALLACLEANLEQLLITGQAFGAVLQELCPHLSDLIFPIKNNFFGGNVDVAGLLVAKDIINQTRHCKAEKLLLPSVIFNDDGLTLDNRTAGDIAQALCVEAAII